MLKGGDYYPENPILAAASAPIILPTPTVQKGLVAVAPPVALGVPPELSRAMSTSHTSVPARSSGCGDAHGDLNQGGTGLSWPSEQEEISNDDLAIIRAQAEWRAKKRREFEEKRRRREEREHAITVSRVAARSKGDGSDYLRPQKKPRLEDHDELHGLHHHHMHHHHHHHHLHHADHMDHIHHHHHHHVPNEMALQLPGVEDGHENMDHLKEVTDQKLAQARWREQKRRELAERKAKKKNYRRGKQAAGSAGENLASAEFSSHMTEAARHIAERPLLVEESVQPSDATASHVAEDVSHLQAVSAQFSEHLGHAVAEPAAASDLKQVGDASHHPSETPLELTPVSPQNGDAATQSEHILTHHHGLPVGGHHPIQNPHSPSEIPTGLDVTLSAQAVVHQSQSQALAADQVLGHPDDDQDLHNNLLSSWQALDPLAPSQ